MYCLSIQYSSGEIRRSTLTQSENATRIAAILIIWILMFFGALTLIAVPYIASTLVAEYSEYTNDFWVITGMLLAPTLLAQSLLIIILVLLRRIRVDQMFSVAAHKWVRVLSYNAAALSATFAVILVWLNIKNSVPPIIGLVLLIGFFLPLAVALVTRTLLVLLKKATAASEELAGVV
jgi:hypothetical protein